MTGHRALRFTIEGQRQRLAEMERAIADVQRRGGWEHETSDSPVPLPFHWTGQVDRFVGVRNGPGEFGTDGTIRRIRYRWDTPASAGATVEWRLDDAVAFTHSVSSANPHIELPGAAYAQQAIVAIVTAVGSDARGLTAFVYLDR